MTDVTRQQYLMDQDGWWHYRRRVPLHMADLDTRHRRFIKVATKIKVADDPGGAIAAKKAAIINTHVEARWADLVAGHADADKRFRLGIKRAAQLGFSYQSIHQVAAASIVDIISRTGTLLHDPRVDRHNPVDQIALIGGVASAASGVLLSQLVEQYCKLTTVLFKQGPGGLAGKNAEQTTRFKSLRTGAVQRLIDQIGDKDILAVSVADANKFTDWCSNYILVNGNTTEGPRKDIDAIRTMIAAICKSKKLPNPDIWGGNPFPRHHGKRNAFSIAFVRDKILAPSALEDMDPVDRDLLHVLIDTGARLSEICGLRKPFIRLADNIPHIAIREDGKQVKSKNAVRDVPLVGVALEAMRRNPNGFPKYLDNASAASKEINKWLKSLLPASDEIKDGDDTTEGTCLYGLRHTFKDRLRLIRAEDEMKVALMGQDFGATGKTPDYGNGYSLESKADVMHQIDFSRAA